MLKEVFIELASKYADQPALTEKLWNEIESMYSEKGRFYHTLSHLENLINELNEVRKEIIDWGAVLFAVYYHDIVYNATSSGNEEKSAELARLRLAELSFSANQIDKCSSMILATEGHSKSTDSDTNYFTDADLSILGKTWEQYFLYTQQIRKEYSFQPDFIYKAGRKNVINHFLKMENIFKTKPFSGKYEEQAKKNLIEELKSL